MGAGGGDGKGRSAAWAIPAEAPKQSNPAMKIPFEIRDVFDPDPPVLRFMKAPVSSLFRSSAGLSYIAFDMALS